MSGRDVSLASYRGKVIILNFFATWCVPCFDEHPVLNQGARALRDVAFLGVIYEDEEPKVRSFLDRKSTRLNSSHRT